MIRSRAVCIALAVCGALTVVLQCNSISYRALELKYANQSSRFIDIDGLKVHYRDEGSGPVLVLLHGIVSSLHTWDGWVSVLSPRYRIIRVDMPTWGLTGAPNFTLSLENYVRFVDRFTERLGLTRFSLAGSSAGGYTAWNYTVAHPEKVDKLILLDAPAYPQKMPFVVNLFLWPVFRSVSTAVTPRFAFNYIIRHQIYGDGSRVSADTVDRYWELMLRPGTREAAVSFFRLMDGLSRQEPRNLSSIRNPVLIMWGRADRWVPVAMTERYRKDLPQARVIIYDGVGHIPMEEAPLVTARDALLFLDGARPVRVSAR